jgi:RecB family exonuclease
LTIDYISFSAWKDWNTCPYKFKITRLDKVRLFEGNEYSTFGTAVHDTSEQLVLLEQKNKDNKGVKDETEFDPVKFFQKRFKEELEKLPNEKRSAIEEKTISQMKQQGKELVHLVIPALKDYFGEYQLFSAEYELRQPVDKHLNFDFYGFVDLIVKTEDDKYHIIDWKTCSWGWDMKKRTSKEYTYQLTYYKHFLSKQLNVDPKNIETHFGLLKRTAKKDKVELFRVTSGERKVQNALNMLDKCVTNIEKKNFIKNKLACSQCEFNKTIYCK